MQPAEVAKLRFNVGSRVAIRSLGRYDFFFTDGEVVALNYHEDDWPAYQVSPYQVRLSGDYNSKLIHVHEDHPSVIRAPIGLGSRVLCNRGGGEWAEGTVFALSYREYDWPPGRVAPYQVRLGAEYGGQFIYVPEDHPNLIQAVEDAPRMPRPALEDEVIAPSDRFEKHKQRPHGGILEEPLLGTDEQRDPCCWCFSHAEQDSPSAVIAHWRPKEFRLRGCYKGYLLKAKNWISFKVALFSSQPCVAEWQARLTAVAMAAHPLSTLYTIYKLSPVVNPWWSFFCTFFFISPICVLRFSVSYFFEKQKLLWEERFEKTFSFYMLLSANARIIWREVRGEPLKAHEEAFIKLYRLTDSFFGNLPWVLFSVYIFARIMSGVHSFQAEPVSLTMNVTLCLLNVYLAFDFFKVYADIVTGGSWRSFLEMLLNLGEGYTNLAILKRIRTQREPIIDEDLSSMSYLGLEAIGMALKTTPVASTCRFRDTRLDEFVSRGSKVAWKNFCHAISSRGSKLRSIYFEPELCIPKHLWAFGGAPFLEILNGDEVLYSRGSNDSLAEAIKTENRWELEKALESGETRLSFDEHLALAVSLNNWQAMRSLLPHFDFLLHDSAILCEAAVSRAAACVELLLSCKTELYRPSFDPEPMIAGCCGGSREVVQMLLHARGSPNLQRGDGHSPISVAAYSNVAEVMSALLQARGDPNLRSSDGGASPVVYASQSNAAKVMPALLEARGDPNLQDFNGASPVFLAVRAGAAEVIPLLLQSRGDANMECGRTCGKRDTPLNLAQELGNVTVLQQLQSAQASQPASHFH